MNAESTLTKPTPGQWHAALLATFLLSLLWSGISPVDRFVWFLEVFPAMVGAVVLMALYPRVKSCCETVW